MEQNTDNIILFLLYAAVLCMVVGGIGWAIESFKKRKFKRNPNYRE